MEWLRDRMSPGEDLNYAAIDVLRSLPENGQYFIVTESQFGQVQHLSNLFNAIL